ncbi:MAG: hypothetical protein WA975_03410 [Mesorhizobium sp.]
MTKDISPNEKIVGLGEGRQTGDMTTDTHGAQLARWRITKSHDDIDLMKIDGDPFSAGLDYIAGTMSPELKTSDHVGADAAHGGASVDLSENAHSVGLRGNIANGGSDRRPVLDQVIDTLSKADLGPDGFFVICHRGAPLR